MATHTYDLREQPKYSCWLLPPPIWPAGMVVRLGLGPGLGPGAGEGAVAGAGAGDDGPASSSSGCAFHFGQPNLGLAIEASESRAPTGPLAPDS